MTISNTFKQTGRKKEAITQDGQSRKYPPEARAELRTGQESAASRQETALARNHAQSPMLEDRVQQERAEAAGWWEGALQSCGKTGTKAMDSCMDGASSCPKAREKT